MYICSSLLLAREDDTLDSILNSKYTLVLMIYPRQKGFLTCDRCFPVASNISPDEVKDKTPLVVDLYAAFINFGLYQAVGAAEIDATDTWKDYDANTTAVGIEGSVPNAVSSVGYFVAIMFKKDVEGSGIGLAVLEGASVGLAAVEGIK